MFSALKFTYHFYTTILRKERGGWLLICINANENLLFIPYNSNDMKRLLI